GPRGSVLWRATIIVVPAILHPLGDIALRVVKSESVRPEGSDRPGLPQRRREAVLAIRIVVADLTAPPERRRRSGARGVFPLGLRRQPIAFAGLLRQPGHEGLRVVPADVDHRALPASPTAIIGAILAAARADARIP